jgi:hypothetical protein
MKATLALAVVALGSLASCKMAWERKENRPVWNAFEAHMVPDGDAAFWAAMPLLAPLGLAAVALDVAVAHPLQTLDDCFADTKSALWSGLDWQDAYVTECGLVPLRAAASPAFFALAFCTRSLFDVTSKEQDEQDQRDLAAAREQRLRRWLAATASGGSIDELPLPLCAEPGPELLRELQAALAQGGPLARIAILQRAAGDPWLRQGADWDLALRDESAAVRALALQALPLDFALPPSTQLRLQEDPDAAVRALAKQRR